MPDSVSIIEVKTRKELKQALESEAYYIRDSGAIGMSKKAIAWLSAECWRNRSKATLDFVAPYRDSYNTSGYPYGLFCSAASKADYRESIAEDN
jgi:hypothetical protein